MEREFYLGYSFQEDLIEKNNLIKLSSTYSELSKKKLSHVTNLVSNLKKKIEDGLEKDINYYLLGLSLAYLKKEDLALENLKKAYDLNPNYFEAYFYTATILYAQKRWEELKIILDRLIALKPSHFESLFYFGLFFFQKKNYLDSQYYFKLSIQANPYSYEASYNLGILFYLTEDYEKSLKKLKSALKKRNSKIRDNLFFYLGNTCYKTKNYLGAIKYYSKFISEDPQNYMAYYNLGLTYSVLESYQKALKSYQKALRIHPIESQILNSIAIILSRKGLHIKSRVQFEKALIISPNHPVLLGNLALELTYQMQYNEAEGYFNKALNFEKGLNKASISLISNYANFLLENLRDDEAFISAKKILEYDSSNIQALNILGICAFRKKNYLESIHIFEKACLIQSPYLKQIYLNFEKILYLIYLDNNKEISESWVSYYLRFSKKLFLAKEYSKVVQIFNWISTSSNLKLYQNSKIFAKSFFKIRNYSKTIEIYNEIFSDPASIKRDFDQLYLAKSYYYLNQFKEAILYFEYLKNTDLKNRIIYYLAKIENKSKNYSNAISFFNQALEEFPQKKSFIFFYLGRIYFYLKNYQQSIHFYLKSIKNPNLLGLVSFFISKNFFYLKEYKKTIEYAKAALIHSPHSKYTFNTYLILGIAYRKIDQHQDSQHFLEKAYKINQKSIYIHYFLALNYQKQKNIKKSILFLENAISIDPYFYKAYFRLALFHFNLKHYLVALEKIKLAFKIEKKDSSILYLFGKIYFYFKKYQKAIFYFELSQKYFSENKPYYKKYQSKIYCYIGECLFFLREYDKAINHFTKSIEFNSNYRNHFFIAKSYFFLKKYQKAEIHFRKTLIFNINHSEIYVFLAKILKERKDYKEAISLYKKALKIEPQNIYSKYALANLYFLKGKHNTAIQHLEKLIEQYPNHIESYILIAQILFKQGREEESIQYFEQASQLDFSSTFLYKKWGYVLSKKKEYEKAIDKYQFILNINPKDLKIRLRLYYILIQLSRYSEAQFKLKEFLNEYPNNSIALFLNAKISYYLASYQDAIEYFHQAIHYNQTLEDKILPFLALSYFKNKNYSKAMQIYSSLIEKDPKKVNYYLFFACSLFHTHNYQKSIENFRIYLLMIENQKKTTSILKIVNQVFFYLSLAYKSISDWEKSFTYLIKSIDYEISKKSISNINLTNLKVILFNLKSDYEKRFSKESKEDQKNILEYIELIQEDFLNDLDHQLKEFQFKFKEIVNSSTEFQTYKIDNDNILILQIDNFYSNYRNIFNRHYFKISKLKNSFELEDKKLLEKSIDDTEDEKYSLKILFQMKIKDILNKEPLFSDIKWKETYDIHDPVKDKQGYFHKIIYNFMKILKEFLKDSIYNTKIVQIKAIENKEDILIKISHSGKKFITKFKNNLNVIFNIQEISSNSKICFFLIHKYIKKVNGKFFYTNKDGKSKWYFRIPKSNF